MRYFVTGATGLIGKQLVPRLLTRGAALTLLVRPASMALHAPLIEGWREMARRHDASLCIVSGDVTERGLGIADAVAPPTAVYHLAAHYDLRADSAIFETVNVRGTENLLAWLASIGFEGVLHHVSSIAVAGNHEGTLREDDLDVGQSHPHAYHKSKFDSESLVRRCRFRHRIYRPSAVVGHSKTGEMDRIDGPYFLFGAMLKLRNALPRWFPLVGPPGGGAINMVPVDWVAGAIDELSHRNGLDGKTFHVVDPNPPSFIETFNLLADAAGAPRMKPTNVGKLLGFVGGGNGRQLLSQLGSVRFLREQILGDLEIPPQLHAAFNPSVSFDTANLRASLNGTLPCPRQAEYLEALWDYWLRNLEPSRDPSAHMRAYFAGKNVLVTGASSGIGAAMARRAAALGAHVVLVARREPELAAVVASIAAAGGSADYFVTDLSDQAACDLLTHAVLERHAHIDILINNAGRSIRRPLSESLERFHDFERVFQINFFAALRLIRGLLPIMRQRRSGHIVNVLSAGTLMPAPRFGVYTSSKAALSQVGDTLAAELADENIHCTAAYLPFVRTPMMDAKVYDGTDAMTPEQAAEWILSGVAKRERRVIQSRITRRYVMNQLAPALSSRMLSIVYRVYADDPSAHPDFELDRSIAKRFIRGRLI